MNEDERGITPADVTAISVEPKDGGWLVIIEQGNGDAVKTLELTEMERVQLALMLCTEPGTPVAITEVSFLDFARHPA